MAAGMAGVDVVAFSIIKKISEKALVPGFAIVSMLLYAMQPILLLQALPFESVAVMNILWNLISCVVVTVLGVFVWKENISTRKILGIVIGIIALFLFTFENEVGGK
jgi:drug/metabolite transporter (DMT)-like permease